MSSQSAATDSVKVSSVAGSITLSDAGLPSQYQSIAYNSALLSSDNGGLWLIDSVGVNGIGVATFGGVGFGAMAGLMPPVLHATAFSGNISIDGSLTLSPSPVGTVDLEAKGSIGGFQLFDSVHADFVYQTGTINLSDANPAAFPGANAPLPVVFGGADVTGIFNALLNETGATLGPASLTSIQQPLHDSALLHANDPDPVRLYAVTGNITGIQSPAISSQARTSSTSPSICKI